MACDICDVRADGDKTALRDRPWNRECVKTIEDAYQVLTEAQREAVSAEFQLGLSSKIFADNFRRNGWSDRLSFAESVKFWTARGIALPSPADVAQKNGSQEPDALKAQIAEFERKVSA